VFPIPITKYRGVNAPETVENQQTLAESDGKIISIQICFKFSVMKWEIIILSLFILLINKSPAQSLSTTRADGLNIPAIRNVQDEFSVAAFF
jgi:hypothetical protein